MLTLNPIGAGREDFSTFKCFEITDWALDDAVDASNDEISMGAVNNGGNGSSFAGFELVSIGNGFSGTGNSSELSDNDFGCGNDGVDLSFAGPADDGG